MLKPSGGFLKKIFNPNKAEGEKKKSPSAVTTSGSAMSRFRSTGPLGKAMNRKEMAK